MKNVQEALLQIKVMKVDMDDGRYTQSLAEDLGKLIPKGAVVAKQLEELILQKDGDPPKEEAWYLVLAQKPMK